MMQKLTDDLFGDTTLENAGDQIAGVCPDLCATQIGGGLTRCITNAGCPFQDSFQDVGQ